MIGPHPVRVECLCSVVGVEYHQGVLVNAQLLEQIEQSTGERIELADEIPSRAGLGPAAEFLGGQDRRMGDLCREECSEWLLGRLHAMRADELSGLVKEQQIRVGESVTFCHPSLIVVPEPLAR